MSDYREPFAIAITYIIGIVIFLIWRKSVIKKWNRKYPPELAFTAEFLKDNPPMKPVYLQTKRFLQMMHKACNDGDLGSEYQHQITITMREMGLEAPKFKPMRTPPTGGFKPVHFPEVTTVIAKNQPEYEPLPAHIDKKGEITTCWEMDEATRRYMARTGRIWLAVFTHENKPMQPIFLSGASLLAPPGMIGSCKECGEHVCEKDRLPDEHSNIFQCPNCGHPHLIHELGLPF